MIVLEPAGGVKPKRWLSMPLLIPMRTEHNLKSNEAESFSIESTQKGSSLALEARHPNTTKTSPENNNKDVTRTQQRRHIKTTTKTSHEKKNGKKTSHEHLNKDVT